VKAIERIAIVLCIATVLRYVSSLFAGRFAEFLKESYGFSDHMAIFWMGEVPRLVTWLLVNVMIAGWIFVDAPRHRISRPVWVALGLATGVLGLAVYLLRVLVGKHESGLHLHPTCRHCGYDLHGMHSDRCPECGTSTA
jgi:ABC-type enterochelin transport system permease subunit